VKKIKDVPVGILIVVLSQFVIYMALCLAKFPSFWEFAGIMFCILVASDMIYFGIRLIKGYEYDPNE